MKFDCCVWITTRHWMTSATCLFDETYVFLDTWAPLCYSLKDKCHWLTYSGFSKMTRVNRIAINNQKLVCIPSQFGLVKFGWELMLSYPVEFTYLFLKFPRSKIVFTLMSCCGEYCKLVGRRECSNKCSWEPAHSLDNKLTSHIGQHSEHTWHFRQKCKPGPFWGDFEHFYHAGSWCCLAWQSAWECSYSLVWATRWRRTSRIRCFTPCLRYFTIL